MTHCGCPQGLDTQFRAAPMTTSGIKSYCTVSFEANPMGNGPILVALFGQSALGSEGFMGRHFLLQLRKTDAMKFSRQLTIHQLYAIGGIHMCRLSAIINPERLASVLAPVGQT